jgi:hypothetical protein
MESIILGKEKGAENYGPERLLPLPHKTLGVLKLNCIDVFERADIICL